MKKGVIDVRRLGAAAAWAATIAVVAGLALPAARGETDAEATAEQLMARAHDTRATWDGFPGFTAELAVSANEQQASGIVEFSADGAVKVSLPEGFEWVETKLQSLADHRRGGGDRKYDVSFADDHTQHPLGRLIKINDDALMGSHYRIGGDVITEVHRTMGDTRFTITVIDVARNREGKYLPKMYTVSFWDVKTGNLKSTSVIRDQWLEVDRWELPSDLLTIETADDGQRVVKEIKFQGHKLLDN
jgi:hypothetical protein